MDNNNRKSATKVWSVQLPKNMRNLTAHIQPVLDEMDGQGYSLNRVQVITVAYDSTLLIFGEDKTTQAMAVMKKVAEEMKYELERPDSGMFDVEKISEREAAEASRDAVDSSPELEREESSESRFAIVPTPEEGIAAGEPAFTRVPLDETPYGEEGPAGETSGQDGDTAASPMDEQTSTNEEEADAAQDNASGITGQTEGVADNSEDAPAAQDDTQAGPAYINDATENAVPSAPVDHSDNIPEAPAYTGEDAPAGNGNAEQEAVPEESTPDQEEEDDLNADPTY